MGKLTFGLLDYIIFLVMLIVPVGLGIYFGFFSKSKNTIEEYLMGGRKMRVIPVAISMTASLFSSLSIMAYPAEIYAFGINFYLGPLTIVLVAIFVCWVVLPIYYENNLSSCYEYVELRFDRVTRKLTSTICFATYTLLLPIFLFLSSAALSQVTHINTHLINAVMNGACVFYTIMGGLRAVIWTDVIQGGVMLAAVILVSIIGINKVGGIAKVINIASEGHRLDVNLTFDLETRMTLWNCMFNNLVYLTTYLVFNQNSVQRLISLPTLKQSRQTVQLFVALYLVFFSIICFNGIIMYSYYHDCDPILTRQVLSHVKLMPYFVQDVAGHLWGMPGIFMSGLFSAALSTVSAAMNALAGVAYFEYVKPYVNHTEKKANLTIKLLTLAIATYNILGSFIFEKMPSVVQLLKSSSGLSFGAIFSCFILGMLVPRVHARSIFWGMLTSIAAMVTLLICAQGKTYYLPLSYSSTEGCATNSSIVGDFSTDDRPSLEGFNLLQLSFVWYIVLGASITAIVSVILSYILSATNNSGYNRKLLAKIVHPLVEYQLTKQDDKEHMNCNKLRSDFD